MICTDSTFVWHCNDIARERDGIRIHLALSRNPTVPVHRIGSYVFASSHESVCVSSVLCKTFVQTYIIQLAQTVCETAIRLIIRTDKR